MLTVSTESTQTCGDDNVCVDSVLTVSILTMHVDHSQHIIDNALSYMLTLHEYRIHDIAYGGLRPNRRDGWAVTSKWLLVW